METKDAGISLILVTHNREAELARTLETLSCLTCPCPWEVIVIDNASDGDMTQVCEASGLEDLRFFRLEVNLGPPGGRNFGAAQARYEYLVFLDDDANFIEENALARIRDRMNREPDFAIFAFQMRNLEGGLYNWPHGRHRRNRKDGTFSTKYFVGGGCAIRASWFAEIGGFSSELFFWGGGNGSGTEIPGSRRRGRVLRRLCDSAPPGTWQRPGKNREPVLLPSQKPDVHSESPASHRNQLLLPAVLRSEIPWRGDAPGLAWYLPLGS